MSGFEIAGVILGAYPILMSALKGYGELARKVGVWNNIRQEYQKCKNEINAQNVAFIGNLRRLLLTIRVDDVTISCLLADPGGQEWGNADLAQSLEKYLQDSHDVFLHTIEDMNRVMVELKREIVIDAENLRQRVEATRSAELSTRLKEAFRKFGTTRDYQLYRMQFTLGETTRKRLFDEIKSYNDRLRNLLETTSAMSQAQKSRDTARKVREDALVCGLWKRADQLYSVLSEAWNCNCRKHHHAHMMLQDRHRPSPEPHFRLMLWSSSPHLPSDQTPQPLFCRPVRVEISNELNITGTVPITVDATTALRPGTSPAHRTATPLRPSTASSKQQKQFLRARVPLITTTLTENNPNPRTEAHELAQREHQQQVPQISSLCITLRQKPSPPTRCHGYLLDAVGTKRYYLHAIDHAADTENSTPSNSNPSKPTAITLETILRDSKTPLTRLQRFSLAVTVASSFIQFAGTPWLKSRWAKSDVVFFPDPDNPRAPGVLPEQPFVSRDFLIDNSAPQMPAPVSPQIRVADRIIDGLESLGIVLLELCFGKPIEQHSSWPSIAPTGSSLLAALEWLKEVAEEAGPEYADAVAWCLIGGRTISTDRGDGWRAIMSDRVVKPLGQCRSYIAPVR
ncbi:uncharacterized protein C8A04DRAFT_14094 [Dichotomopilus funicola]|uniref:DUF7580 domain-containing protein n=1 Tax=Dichotomopilus funicola TaxID=1934379 RepID=A0AAN6ZKP7_9PEZI|nr:hypothetical protein C8A04DRAFT_14094 [Dichotomopilus funicola]